MFAQQHHMTETTPVCMKQRQAPLRSQYVTDPGEAWITDSAATSCHEVDTAQAIHGQVTFGDGTPATLNTGIRRAIGGNSDLPNPGEILAAALATCLDSTIRIIANLMGVRLTHLEVRTDLKVDVRGTLMVNRTVPVGFQDVQVRITMSSEGASDAQLDMLLKAAEKSCVVLQTLRDPPAIAVSRTATVN